MESSSNNAMYIISPDKEGPSGPRKLKRLMLVLVIVVALVVALIVAYLLTSKEKEIDATQPVHTVRIDQDGFTPSTIKIKKGEELAWVNNSANAHEVTADQDDAPGLNSTTPLAQGDSYIFTFEKTGTVRYYDPLNPTVYKGTVIVE